jgi:hypothetical protein
MIGDIITRLLADSNITADVSTRIFPVHVDQDATLPAIMVTITDMETHDTKTATSTDDILELDLTVYSKSAKQGFDIAENIRTSLDNFTGTMGSTTVLSLRFESLNLNHFAGDDVFICGSEFRAHIRR